MCMSKRSSTPKPPPPPAPAAPAPTEIENAVESSAEQQKKKRKGTRQLRRGNSGVQIGSTENTTTGTGLTINK